MPVRTNGGVFNEQVLTGSLRHFVLEGADFSGAINQFGQPVPYSAAEIIFNNISGLGYINIMNPNENNISFALEINRSGWDETTITEMVRSLGPDVGIDHIDCTLCTCREVPYIWDLGSGLPGTTSFLQLSDTPNTYFSNAGSSVVVNQSGTGLTFGFIGADYVPASPGTVLSFGRRYFITGSGTVTLPAAAGTGHPAGSAVIITKPATSTVFINVFSISDIISTDLGNTDSIEFDATQEIIMIFDGVNTWNLQIGSVNA